MPKRGAKTVAVFLIYILVLMMLNSSIVWAQFFVDAYGSDQVIGFRRATEDITILNATAKDERTPGILESKRIVLLSDPTARFECNYNNATGYTECETTIPEEMTPGEYLYEMQLFNPDMETPTFSKKTARLLVDNQGPEILGFKVKAEGSEVVADYQVADRLCQTCPATTCSGIKKVRFTSGMDVVGEKEHNTEECLIENQTSLELFTAETSTRELCIEAEDRLGQKTRECDDFVIDFKEPELVNASLWAGNRKLEYYTGEPLGSIELRIYLEEESGLNESTLEADLSSLNTREEFQEAYKNINTEQQNFGVSCTDLTNKTENLWECKITGLLIYLPSLVQNPTAKFSIEDIAGNKFQQDIPLPLTLDGTDPVITNIRTGMSDDRGRHWISPNINNTIYVDITEEDSGMSQRRIFLDFSALGPQDNAGGQTVLQANNCSEGWTCEYHHITVSDEVSIPTGDVLSIDVKPGSTDDAGNEMTGLKYGGFYYDDEPPELLSYSQPTICPVYGDTVTIQVNVTEPLSGGVSMDYDAREVSTRNYPQTTQCEQNDDDTWTCEMTIDQLITIGVEGEINITLRDLAGNENKTTIPLTVCEAAPGTPPNLISCYGALEGWPRPDALDRKIASQMAMPMFIKPDCSSNNPNVEVQDVTLEGCIMTDGTIIDPYLLEKEDPITPTISVPIQLVVNESTDEDDLEDEIEFSCTLNYRVRAGTKVYTEAEKEEITFSNIPAEELPLGYIEDAVKEDLEDLKKDIGNLQKKIEDMEAANKVFGTICTIGQIAVVLMQALLVAKQAIHIVALVMHGMGYESAAKKLFFQVCRLVTWVAYIVVTFLWNTPGYLITKPTPGTIFRFVCSFYTCKLANANKWARVIPIFGSIAGKEGGGRTLSGGDYTYFWQAEDAEKYDWTEQGGTEVTMDEEGEVTYNLADDVKEGTTVRAPIIPEDAGDDAKESWKERTSWDPKYVGRANFLSTYNFDPWKSYNTAMLTACLPMIIYNKKKLRQLKCLKYRCIKSRAEAGFDTQVCEEQYRITKCLYYDGAIYKVTGVNWKTQSLWRNYIMTFFAELPVIALGIGVKKACQTAYGKPECKTWRYNNAWQWVGYSLLAPLIPYSMLSKLPGMASLRKWLECPFYDGTVDYKRQYGESTTCEAKGGGKMPGQTITGAVTKGSPVPEVGEQATGQGVPLITGMQAEPVFPESGTDITPEEILGDSEPVTHDDVMKTIEKKLGKASAPNYGCADPKSHPSWNVVTAMWGVLCDIPLAVLYGVDIGEWITYKSSWDVKKLFRDLEGEEYCEGIE